MAFVSVWLGTGQSNLVTAYQTSIDAAECRAARGTNDDFTGVNYATFRYQIPGVPTVFVNTQASSQYHSEKQVWCQLCGIQGFNCIAIPNWKTGEGAGTPKQTADQVAALGTRILSVYTEREPCGSCSPFLHDILPNGTEVRWHFPWPSAETKKHKHGDDTIIVSGLMAISRGTTYAEGTKSYQRTDRVEGNTGLTKALKEMKGAK